MKKLTLLALTLCSFLLAALPPMTDEKGMPLLVPSVQKMTAQKGAFILPATLNLSAPKDFCTKPLEQAYLEKISQAKFQTVGKTACLFELTTKAVPQNPEGYTLKITPAGIHVASRTQQGLFYGMQTLIQYIRNTQGNQLKCCAIEDWPDLKMRGFFFELPYLKSSQTARLCKVIETLAHLKYNTILIEFADNFPYENVKFAKRKFHFSKENVLQLMEAAKRNHIELIPTLQVGSHTKWILNHASSPAILECKRERGWNTAYCLSNKEAEQIVLTVIQEQCDLLKPKKFHMGLDEFTLNPDFHKCPLCSKVDPVQLVASHAIRIQKMLLDRGITPIVYDDEFTSAYPHRGYRPYTAILEKFDRRVAINCWDYTASPSDAPYKDHVRRGFKQISYMSWFSRMPNVMNLPRLAYKVGADGCILSAWYAIDAPMIKHESSCTDQAFAGVVFQAIYNWKPMEKDFTVLPVDSHQILRRLLDPQKMPVLQGKPTRLPLTQQFNAFLGAEEFFPVLSDSAMKKAVAAAAADPASFALVTKGNLYEAIALGCNTSPFPAKTVAIPVNGKFKVISLLNCLSPTNTYVGRKTRSRKENVGELRFVYSDGTQKKIPLRFKYNVQNWNEYHGAYEARIVWNGTTANNALCKFFALDLKNPLPEKIVKEIVISSNPKEEYSLAIFAVSLFGATAQYANANVPNPKAPVYKTATFEDAYPLFSQKAQDISTFQFMQTPRFYSGTATHEVVKGADGTPEILIKIPAMLPAKDQKLSKGSYGRVYFNIPYPAGKKFNAICLEVSCKDPKAFTSCNYYTMSTGSKANALLNAQEGLRPGWNPFRLCFAAFTEKENGGVAPGEEKSIRLSFRIKNDTATELRIRNIVLTNAKIPAHHLIFAK